MKPINNKGVVSTDDQLIDIAVQAANAKRRKPFDIQPNQSVNPEEITNVIVSNDVILQEVKKVFNRMEIEIKNSKAFNEYNMNLIHRAISSLKDDLLSKRIKIDTKSYQNFREFFIDNLSARLQQMNNN